MSTPEHPGNALLTASANRYGSTEDTRGLPRRSIDMNNAMYYERSRSMDMYRSRSSSRTRTASLGRVSRAGSLGRRTRRERMMSYVSDGASEEEEEKTPSVWSAPRSKKLLLVCLAAADILNFMCLSLMAPFFPYEANQKGVSNSTSGWIFGVFSLVQCITSPLFGRLMVPVGSKFVFIAGNFVSGVSCALFGILAYVPTDDGPDTFIGLAFLIRIVLALGGTACSTSTFAMATSAFPDNPAFILGLLESCIGVGLMLGPALGGFIYELWGFMAPFLAVGITIVLLIPLYFAWVPRGQEAESMNDESDGSVLRILFKTPAFWIINIAIFLAATIWITMDPTLEPHLREFDLSASQVGLIFLLLSGSYAICAPIVGKLADILDNSTPLMIFGLVLSAVGQLLLGPSPLIGLDSYQSLWLNLLSLVILGIGISFAVVPTMDKLFDISEKAGIAGSMELHSAVGGMWCGSYALGEFVGPVLAGWLLDTIGFDWLMTLMASISLCVVVLMTIFYIGELNDIQCCSPGAIKKQKVGEHPVVDSDPVDCSDDEKRPLRKDFS